MNTVQDAYQPPVNGTSTSKFWVRITLLSIILAVTLGLTILSGMRLAADARVREMNSNRGPVNLNPSPRPDGSGVQE